MKIKSLISAAVLSLVFAAPAIASANPELSVTPQSVLKGEAVTYHAQGVSGLFVVNLKPSACKLHRAENGDLGKWGRLTTETEGTIPPEQYESLGVYHVCLYPGEANSAELGAEATFETVTLLPSPAPTPSPIVTSVATPTVASEPTTGPVAARVTHAAVPSKRAKAVAKCKRLNRHKRKKLARCLRKAKRLH
jgi:hypothetical protein